LRNNIKLFNRYLNALTGFLVCSVNEPWSFTDSHSPHAFYKSVYLEVNAAPHYNNRDGVID